ncbi:MAG: SRPBCC domain-containing protein [Candidatus Obscuribacterales bacterium]
MISHSGGSFAAWVIPQWRGRAHYLEITRPHRIVYTQQFCDEQENLARHPMAPTWACNDAGLPSTGKTNTENQTVTITWECYGDTTDEEL